MPIIIHNDDPLCIIDLSYFIFYRYFALQKWMKMSETTLTDEEMLLKFTKVFQDHLKNVSKKLKIPPKNIIMVGDCRRSEIWRNDIYPQYKQRDSSIPPNIFPFVYENIIPTLKDIQFICIESLEADDIAYVITSYVKNDVTIITNDNDYLQMLNEKTRIVNLPSFKDISDRCKDNPRVGLMTKVLCGDPSDTIEGIVSKKVAKELIEQDANDHQFIEKYMIEHGLKEKYDLNMRLIDMSNIPLELKEKVLHSMRYKNEYIQFI